MCNLLQKFFLGSVCYEFQSRTSGEFVELVEFAGGTLGLRLKFFSMILV